MAPFPIVDTPPAGPPTGAVVALKPVATAKSRLAPLPDALRRRLAWTMAVDTLTALADAVDQVLVVSDEPALQSRLERLGLAVTVLAEPGPGGMNAALAYGAGQLTERGCGLVLACVGDVPALRPVSVRRVLAAAQGRPRSHLADASGVGTTMLLAHGALLPRFQGPSAAAHRASGAEPLTDDRLGGAVPDARRDVDTVQDLAEAVALGVGPATRALLAADSGRPAGDLVESPGP